MKEARLLVAQSLRPGGLVEVREALYRTKKKLCYDLVVGLEVPSTLALMWKRKRLDLVGGQEVAGISPLAL